MAGVKTSKQLKKSSALNLLPVHWRDVKFFSKCYSINSAKKRSTQGHCWSAISELLPESSAAVAHLCLLYVGAIDIPPGACQLRSRIREQWHRSSVGPTVFRGKFGQIPRASSQNSVAHRGKIVQIPWLTAAFRLCIN